MATRYGDADRDGNEDFRNAQFDNKRRSTKYYTSPTIPNHGFVFKAFTRDSLNQKRQRRSSSSTARGKKYSTACSDGTKFRPQAPDPFLASGQQLPPAFTRQLPLELIGKPIEDIDPYYENQETFIIISRGKELTRFSATEALYMFGPFHPIRRVVLYILVNPIFNLLVISTILINCILMTIQGSEIVEKTEIIFTVVYTIEMGLKVLARGFIIDDFTYLRDPWNWLDFLVIIMAYLTIVIRDLGNLSVMRTFRVLRALKTVAIIPGMKTIVGAVIDSVKNLKDVVVLTLFSLSVFSLLGLQIYMGVLTQKCIKNGPDNMTDSEWFEWNSNNSNWVAEPDDEIFGARSQKYRLCGNATGAQSCPVGYTCIQGFGPNPDYNYTNFDTFGWALICSFRLMTQDFWEGLYMQVLKTAGSWHIIFFIVSIFLGSIYLMNLILAIVAMSYNELQRRAEQEEEAAAEDEAAFLESCRLMEMQDQISDYSNNSSFNGPSSYRPSIEIGLVGQSILASLCQNGTLGRHVVDKLSKQMVMTNSGNPYLRSHSLSENHNQNEKVNDITMPNKEQMIRTTSMAQNYYYVPVTTASSMTELRRKSSVRNQNDQNGFNQATPSSRVIPTSPRGHLSNQLAASAILSTTFEDRRRDLGSGRSGPRQSTTSDRDLSILKKRAASIRIEDNLAKQCDGVKSLDTVDQSCSQSTCDQDLDRLSIYHKPTYDRYNRRLSTQSSISRWQRSHKRNSYSQQEFDSLQSNISPKSESIEYHQAIQNAGTSQNQFTNANQSFSDAVICKQPTSINLLASVSPSRRSSTSKRYSIISNQVYNSNSTDQSNASQKSCIEPVMKTLNSSNHPQTLRASTQTLHANLHLGQPINQASREMQQLSIDRCIQPSNRMHHLSVENFQQFGTSRIGSSLQQQSNSNQMELANSSSTLSPGSNVSSLHRKSSTMDDYIAAQNDQLANLRYDNRYTSSRGNIHPSTMVRPSFSRPSGNLVSGPFAYGARRVSKDFTRRASDWSRLSMSANVDLRRLLRLWSHTNPYQSGRPSIGSFSNYNPTTGSPAHSIKDTYSRINSPRPSSVGSARQAYEIMSAFSRHHNQYPSDPRAGYAMPIDDNMMDNISVNMRDKCLAYCLSCLDVLCIWECCGAWLKVQKVIALIVFDPFTELFIILCIVINTLFMALDSDDAEDWMRTIFERGNYFFTATFAIEAWMKIMALSPKFYFRESWNVFDSIIVGLSLLELGLEGVYGLSVLRSFRLLRVFKLAKSWPTLNLLISIMGKAVGDLGNLTFVLAIIVFIFAVMGMQLFGNKYVGDKFPSGELPRWNFTDFMHSFMIVFRILCAEWIEPMWDCLLVCGWPCIPFFLTAVTVGNLVVLNLFLALLLASFGASNLSSPQADNVDTNKLQEAIARFARFGRWIKKKVGRILRLTVSCLLRRKQDLQSGQFMDSDGSHKGKPVKSRIAAMSRLERLKNIELRTEELKSKIKRSPEHHYHLKRLAKSQLKESSENPQFSYDRRSGYMYHHVHQPGKRHQASQDGTQIACIPIIVNEASDTNEDTEEYEGIDENRLDSRGSVAMSEVLESSGVSIESPEASNQSDFYPPLQLHKQTGRHLSYSLNMQPIKEDSKDAESSSSLSEIDTRQHENAKDKQTLESLDKMESIQEGKAEVISICDNQLALERNTGDLSEQIPPNESCLVEEDICETDEDKPKSSLYLKPPKRQDMEEDDERTLQRIETYIEKCICLGILCLKWFLLRRKVRKIVEHRYFDQCILILIVISSGTLALEDIHLKERPNLKRTLDILDTIFTIVFSLEMIFKWLAFGMKRYFGNIWCWLDFVIVLVSLINLMASVFGSGKIQALKTMRTLRAMRGLRPLRALQRFQGMRVVVNALIQAIPSIFNVLLVCLIFWLIFSIMGVQMFGGKFWRCLNPETGNLVTSFEAANRIECIERNLTWSNPQINFDNVLNAYLALFQVATFKGWIDIMNSAVDSRARDDQPGREANIYMYFYFVFFVIVGSFFTLNLFIGVIIDNFNEQKKKTGGSLEIFMTDDQKKYYHAMKKMRSKRPVKAMTRPKFKLQAYMFDITTSKKFDLAIMIIIGLNMFVMSLEHHGQSHEFSKFLEDLNLTFIAIFTLECLCKIFAMRHFYFREPWNVFDFIVVVLSLLGVVMKEYVAKYFVSPTLLRVVRVVKVGRVLRLVKGAKGIRTLLFALAMSLPALFNICLLLFMVMFIYAIFGMSFFMNVRKRSGIDETFNFETFSSSIIVLFQMSTSAAWDIVLDPLMDEENDCQKPDPVLGIEGTCGNKSIAIFYLVSYVIVTFLIIINMYIAVILENYSQATEDVEEGLTDDDYEMYYEIWQKFDPNGTQYLPYEKLSDFVDALEDPLRIAKPNSLALVVLDITIYQGNRCYCVDILDALTKYFFTRKGLDIQVNEHLQQVQSTLHETPFERLTTTYLLKREDYCARLIQRCWRRWREGKERCQPQ